METIKEKLKLMAGSMKSGTLNTLLKNDTEYQRVIAQVRRADEKYRALKLSEEDEETVGTLIARRDEAETERVVNAYMAEILDGYEIMKSLGMVEE